MASCYSSLQPPTHSQADTKAVAVDPAFLPLLPLTDLGDASLEQGLPSETSSPPEGTGDSGTG